MLSQLGSGGWFLFVSGCAWGGAQLGVWCFGIFVRGLVLSLLCSVCGGLFLGSWCCSLV